MLLEACATLVRWVERVVSKCGRCTCSVLCQDARHLQQRQWSVPALFATIQATRHECSPHRVCVPDSLRVTHSLAAAGARTVTGDPAGEMLISAIIELFIFTG